MPGIVALDRGPLRSLAVADLAGETALAAGVAQLDLDPGVDPHHLCLVIGRCLGQEDVYGA